MFEDYTATKLTHLQKRGHAAAKGGDQEYHNDRRTLDAPKAREAGELRAAQLALAGMAVDQEHPAAWLGDVLDALGLRYRVEDRPVVGEGCGEFQGTRRGYEMHLRSYTSPCNMCDAVARAAEASRLRRLGINTDVEGAGQWTVSTTC